MRLAQNASRPQPLANIHNQRHVVQQSLYGSVPPNMVLKERKDPVFREMTPEELKRHHDGLKIVGGAIVGFYTLGVKALMTLAWSYIKESAFMNMKFLKCDFTLVFKYKITHYIQT